MTDLQVFNNPEFGSIRTLDDGTHTLFCGADIAKALGYSNPRKALTDHCKGVTKRNTPTPGGEQEMSFIPESDLYRLIFGSKLPNAEKFTDWVTEVVLPTIRKTGSYGTPSLSELSPQLRYLIELEQRQTRQAQAIVQLNQKLDQLQGMRGFAEGGWRRESARVIARITQARGGSQYTPLIYQEAYTLLEAREHCSLTCRLAALRSSQMQQGVSKSKAARLGKMDAIATSPESVERWLKILQELAVKYGAEKE